MRRAGLLAVCTVLLATAGASAAASPTASRGDGASVRVDALLLSVPQGFHQYDIQGPVERVVTDYRLTAHSPLRGGVFPMSEPERTVALDLAMYDPLAAPPPPAAVRLHMPLNLRERWSHNRASTGIRRYGLLRYKKQLYQVLVWIGRKAPPDDRKALVRALASIGPAR